MLFISSGSCVIRTASHLASIANLVFPSSEEPCECQWIFRFV